MAKHPSLSIHLSVLALCIAACGSSSPAGNPASAAMFVGSWTAQLGAAEVDQCAAKSDTVLLVGAFNISLPSAGSGVIQSVSENGCLLKWTANGNVATLDGTQTCNVPAPQGGEWNATFISGTLTLAGGSIVLQDSGNGVLSLNGTNANCSFKQSGTFNST